MIKWLSRYVKQINVMGVGIELREFKEIPAEEAIPLLKVQPQLPASQPTVGKAEPAAPIVRKEDYIRLIGTSVGGNRVPREIDLMVDGEEIQIHIHSPVGTQSYVWVGRDALNEAFDRHLQQGGRSGEINVTGRLTRKEAPVVFIFDESDEVEVKAGWRIWVPKQDLKAALAELGVRAPW